jgi:NADPH2:quinone reductase
MKATWYEHQGPARDVLVVGEMDVPMPGEGEVRIRIEASGISSGDVKKRQDAFGVGMPFPASVSGCRIRNRTSPMQSAGAAK